MYQLKGTITFIINYLNKIVLKMFIYKIIKIKQIIKKKFIF